MANTRRTVASDRESLQVMSPIREETAQVETSLARNRPIEEKGEKSSTDDSDISENERSSTSESETVVENNMSWKYTGSEIKMDMFEGVDFESWRLRMETKLSGLSLLDLVNGKERRNAKCNSASEKL